MEPTSAGHDAIGTSPQSSSTSERPEAPLREQDVREEAPSLGVRIVNADPKYQKAKLVEPTNRGYLYIAASVRPSPTPFVLPSVQRKRLLDHLKELALDVARVESVVAATVFRAVAVPPTARMSAYLKHREGSLQLANFDVLILVQTASPASVSDVRSSSAYHVLLDAVAAEARAVYAMSARNVRRIGDVDLEKDRLFLFNHFAADDRATMLELWEHLAGWYTAETGLANSIALAPMAGERQDYAVVNWASWDEAPFVHFARQLFKRSFWNFVVANLEANRAGAMPVYCRMA